MADACGSRFLTHPRGPAMQQERAELLGHIFDQLGLTTEGHHGTANQRMRSALSAMTS